MKTLHFYADNTTTSKQAKPVSITIFATEEKQVPGEVAEQGLQKLKPFVLYALGSSQYALNIGKIESGQSGLVAKLQDAGTVIANNRESYGLHNIFINFDPSIPAIIENIRWVLLGFRLGSYEYHHSPECYLNNNTPELVSGDPIFNSTTDWANNFATGVVHARELLNKPANIIYPESFVEAVKALDFSRTKISVLDQNELSKLGFGGMVGVAQGSSHQAQLLIMDYAPENYEKTLVLVGKGVTFDSGGISIKGAKNMSTMKFDMGGAAAVVGALEIIEQQNVPVRVIGICGLVENMPSDHAQRPGDVVTMLNQKSVEIISTDAEGRMVLADVLTYAQNTYKPDYLLDIATLTGGAGIALGKEYSALMSNNDEFVKYIERAAELTAEPVWRMPIGGWYRGVLKSEYADYRHGSEDPHGSPCVAATFLSEFINPDQAWAHLDIAAFEDSMPHRKLYSNGGASAYGALLLVKLSKLIGNQI